MYINKVLIENYRGFRSFEATLSKLTVIIGENDSGKSNFISALALPLSSSNLDYNLKKLSVSDINADSIQEFYQSIIDNEDERIQLQKIPCVSVTLQFRDPQGFYETEIVRKWANEDNDKLCFQMRYDFKPKNNVDFLSNVKELLKNCETITDRKKWFTLPMEHYDYQIVSTNNEKQISFNDLKHVVINTIGADRDDFSYSNTMKSNNMLTKLLINTLEEAEKNRINSAYTKFFSEIQETDAFEKVLKSNDDFENIKEYVNEIDCIPNLPNLKNILSNITLGYGDGFLYQKGLGKRNLIYIFLLFTYYKSTQESFNLCCIEEPEAHLSVNNLRLALDFINKSVQKSDSLLQTILTTHSPGVINKLKINNVVAFSGNKAISFSNASQGLVDYLRKRPNFDILKLLFAERVILVEGPSEEMLINTLLSTESGSLNNIEVISIGQKGYKTFLDIWLKLNKENLHKRIGVVRDFDNQPKAKEDHDTYDDKHKNITVRTTKEYTLEDDLVRAGDNCKVLAKLLEVDPDFESVSITLKDRKTEGMLKVCDAILSEDDPIKITLPTHIDEVIKAL